MSDKELRELIRLLEYIKLDIASGRISFAIEDIDRAVQKLRDARATGRDVRTLAF